MNTDYVLDIETLKRLIYMVENDKFYRMPSGLTREERRAWAKANAEEISKDEVQDRN